MKHRKSLYLPLAAIVAMVCILGIRALDGDPVEPSKKNPKPSRAAEPQKLEIAPPRPPKIPEPAIFRDSLKPLPASTAPPFLKTEFLSASLEALAGNGSDLSLPMPSKHLIRSESKEISEQIKTWGQQHSFDVSQTTIFRGHGGVEFFDVELIRTEVPDVSRIQEQGNLIRNGINTVNGAVYTTWVGQIMTR